MGREVRPFLEAPPVFLVAHRRHISVRPDDRGVAAKIDEDEEPIEHHGTSMDPAGRDASRPHVRMAMPPPLVLLLLAARAALHELRIAPLVCV